MRYMGNNNWEGEKGGNSVRRQLSAVANKSTKIINKIINDK